MSADESVIGGLAGRYAVALFELTQELPAAQAKTVAGDVDGLKALIQDNESLQKLIKSPVISAAEQAAALSAVLDKAGLHELVKNFAALVVSKRRAFALVDMASQFNALSELSRDETTAYVTSARDLTAEQIKSLKSELNQASGKTVLIEAETDAALLGGMVVKIGSRMIDGSLRTKLNSLKTALSEG